jgi:hypothetical protein
VAVLKRVVARTGKDGAGLTMRCTGAILADGSSSTSTATGQRRTNGIVLGLAGVLASKWVKGGIEGECEATGRAGVLARP